MRLPEIDTAQFRSEAMDPFARIAIGEDPEGSPEEQPRLPTIRTLAQLLFLVIARQNTSTLVILKCSPTGFHKSCLFG
jgi:hypothetical protein